jgi:1-acyl-sn-glycerol-3-phosphate acyltransferase
MTRIVRRTRLLLGVLAFVLVGALLAAPHFYLLLLWSRLSRADRSLRRKRAARWFMNWGRRLFAVMAPIMGIRWRIEAPTHPYARGSGPFIVVPNHFGAWDGFLLAELFAMMGRDDMRTVAMAGARNIPVFGHAMCEAGCAFVARSKDPRDVAWIERLAAEAKADGVSVAIFPEGRIFNGSLAGSDWRNVMPPKTRGLAALVCALPEYPVLSVTIHWRDFKPTAPPFDGAFPPGTDVVVTAEIVSVGCDEVRAWLQEEWRRKDRVLDDKRKK